MAALADYVDFSPLSAQTSAPSFPRVEAAPVPGRETLPRKGMTRVEAERQFGRPVESSDRREGSLAVSRVVFVSGDERITGEFVEDVLVRYTIASK